MRTTLQLERQAALTQARAEALQAKAEADAVVNAKREAEYKEYAAGEPQRQLELRKIQPLLEDKAVTSITIPSPELRYFSIAVDSPGNDLFLEIAQLSGNIEFYVTVQNASLPTAIPTDIVNNHLYRMDPSMGQQGMLITANNSKFCKALDGSTNGTPCVYIVGIRSKGGAGQDIFIISFKSSSSPKWNLIGNASVNVKDGEISNKQLKDVVNMPQDPMLQLENGSGRKVRHKRTIKKKKRRNGKKTMKRKH